MIFTDFKKKLIIQINFLIIYYETYNVFFTRKYIGKIKKKF